MKFLYFLPFIILAIVLLYFLICLYVFKRAFARKKDIDWNDKEALKKTFYKDFLDVIDNARVWLAKNNPEYFTFTTFDGLELEAFFVKCENARGTVVLAHGYQGSAISDFGMVFNTYKEKGLNILAYRQRSHGNSQGKYVTFGALEHKDLISLIEYHNKNFGDFPVVLSGISMGASTVLYAISSPDLPPNVKGASADCGFTSGYEIVKKVIKDILHFDGGFLMPGTNFWCKVLAKFDAKKYSTETLLKNAKVPVVFIHGEADDFVPCEMTIKSYNACASEKQLVLVKDAGHGTSYVKDPNLIENTLNEFFDKVLKE